MLTCQPDRLVCVLSIVHVTLSASAGRLSKALVCCLLNLSCLVALVLKGRWTCHSDQERSY